MPPKPKRKARGIVAWACRFPRSGRYGMYEERVRAAKAVRESPSGGGWRFANAHHAGCPRLKPGEVKKVRVIIEEVK